MKGAKHCSVCGERFEKKFAYCPVDGSVLPPVKLIPNIFICYRREDSGAETTRLYEQLNSHFNGSHLSAPADIFMDISSVQFGDDFVDLIKQKIYQCQVFIAVIGKQWLTLADPSSNSRLANANDFVRREIAMALNRDIRLIPVLVQGAVMPQARDLPEDISKLAQRHSHKIRHDSWSDDVNELIRAIEKWSKELSERYEREFEKWNKGQAPRRRSNKWRPGM